MTNKTIYGCTPIQSSIDNRYHYVYRITNLVEGKHYYGSRTSTISPMLDLGSKYFGTPISKNNKWIVQDQKNNPTHYKYKILQCFETRKQATNFEVIVHKKFDVKNHSKFYNEVNQTSSLYDTTGKCCAKLIDGTIIGSVSLEDPRWKTGEIVGIAKGRVDMYGENNHFFGKSHSAEARHKISEKAKIRGNPLKWFTDGVSSIYINPVITKIPFGFHPGRTMKRKSDIN